MTTLTSTIKPIPSPGGTLQIIKGMRQRGFLQFIGDMWQAHGDLFQLALGSRKLIFAMHPEAVRHVSITNRQNYDKLQSYDSVRRYLLGDGLLASTGDFWRRQRKLMAPFYTPKGVNAYADIMLHDAARLVDRWEGITQYSSQVEISEEMTFVTASIILKAMFSMETQDEIVGMKNAVETMIAFVSSGQSSLIKFPLWVPTMTNRTYQSARTLVHTYIKGVIDARRTIPEADRPDDLLTRLMQARDEETGEPMSESLLRDEAITTFFAGHETTARTMTFVWYALATNPDVEARLHEELDAVVGGRIPTLSDLHNLPYTLSVIKETLRLYPPAPYYVRDAIAADSLDGYAIPAGSSIMLSPYYTHRHPDFWDEPLRFDPDRWTPEREAARHPYAYHPFAAGQRVCIGNNFSLLESHILLALLGQKFTLRLPEGFTPQWVARGTLGTANGMPMLIQRRQE